MIGLGSDKNGLSILQHPICSHWTLPSENLVPMSQPPCWRLVFFLLDNNQISSLSSDFSPARSQWSLGQKSDPTGGYDKPALWRQSPSFLSPTHPGRPKAPLKSPPWKVKCGEKVLQCCNFLIWLFYLASGITSVRQSKVCAPIWNENHNFIVCVTNFLTFSLIHTQTPKVMTRQNVKSKIRNALSNAILTKCSGL